MQVLNLVERHVLGVVCERAGFVLTEGILTRDSAVALIRRARAELPYESFRTRALMHLIELLYSSEMNDAELQSAAVMAQTLGSCDLLVALLGSGISATDALEIAGQIQERDGKESCGNR